MTNISKRKKHSNLKSLGDHDEFLSRITKSLYYAKLPKRNGLTLPVTEFAAEFFTEVHSGHTLERLEVEEASRISQNACVSSCSLVLALLYLERLKDCNPEYLQRVAPSELFLVSLMVASKFLHDDGEDDEVFNAEWAEAGDLPLIEMNRLERQFLSAINWTIYVHKQDFWEKLKRLEKDIAYKEAQKRGWFSYTELACLLDSVQLLSMVQTLLSVSSVCLAAYTAGVVTLVGSAFLASQLPGTMFIPKPSLQANDSSISTFETLPQSKLKNESCKSCQQTLESTNITKYNEPSQNVEWWLDSMMVWLPEYSDLQSETNEKFEQAKNFVTSSEFEVHEEALFHGPEGLFTEINWKETLDLTLKFPYYNWQYYLSSASKMFISHRY